MAIIINNSRFQTRASEQRRLKAHAQHRSGPVAVEHCATCYTSFDSPNTPRLLLELSGDLASDALDTRFKYANGSVTRAFFRLDVAGCSTWLGEYSLYLHSVFPRSPFQTTQAKKFNPPALFRVLPSHLQSRGRATAMDARGENMLLTGKTEFLI